jgi:hypothetical protein
MKSCTWSQVQDSRFSHFTFDGPTVSTSWSVIVLLPEGGEDTMKKNASGTSARHGRGRAPTHAPRRSRARVPCGLVHGAMVVEPSRRAALGSGRLVEEVHLWVKEIAAPRSCRCAGLSERLWEAPRLDLELWHDHGAAASGAGHGSPVVRLTEKWQEEAGNDFEIRLRVVFFATRRCMPLFSRDFNHSLKPSADVDGRRHVFLRCIASSPGSW